MVYPLQRICSFFLLKIDDPSLLNGIFRNVARNRDGNCAFLAILPTNPLCIRKLARRQAIFCSSTCHAIIWTNYLQTIRKLIIIDIWWLSFNLNPNFSNWQNDLYSRKTISKTIFLTVRIYIIFEEIYLIRFKFEFVKIPKFFHSFISRFIQGQV